MVVVVLVVVVVVVVVVVLAAVAVGCQLLLPTRFPCIGESYGATGAPAVVTLVAREMFASGWRLEARAYVLGGFTEHTLISKTEVFLLEAMLRFIFLSMHLNFHHCYPGAPNSQQVRFQAQGLVH